MVGGLDVHLANSKVVSSVLSKGWTKEFYSDFLWVAWLAANLDGKMVHSMVANLDKGKVGWLDQ